MGCRARYSISEDLKWGELLLLKSRLQKGLLVSQATTQEARYKERSIKVSLVFIFPSKSSAQL